MKTRISLGMVAAATALSLPVAAQYCPAKTTYFASSFTTGCVSGTCWSASAFQGSSAASSGPKANFACAATAAPSDARENTLYDYDLSDNLVSQVDPLGRVTAHTYDALNHLLTTTDAKNKTTTYQYDGQDQLTKVTDPQGLYTFYSVDGLHRVTALTSPDTGVTTYDYDAASNLQTKTDPRPISATDTRRISAAYTYDTLGRVKTITYPDEVVTYTYESCTNGIGRLCQVTDNSGTTAYAYEVHGRVTEKTQTVNGVSQVVRYAYNAAGQLAKVTLPSGNAIIYTYTNNRPTSAYVNGQLVFSGAIYEPFGPVGSWSWGNSTSGSANVHKRTYDADYRASRISSDRPSAGDSAHRLDLGFNWDLTGTLHQLSDNTNRVLPQIYTYDKLDRLATSAQANLGTHNFDYDGNGNVTSDGTLGWSYYPLSNRLMTPNNSGIVLHYDDAGNMDIRNGVTWKYAGNNRPTDAGTTRFTFNALGQRVRKSSPSDSRRFIYDEAGHLLGEYNDTGGLIQETVWLGDLPVAVITN